MHLIDTHAHLNDPQFSEDIDDVILRAKEAGVERIIIPGYDIESSRAAVEIASHYDCIYATVGVHPHDAKNYDDTARQTLVELSRNPKVIAIGEIGLDFHYDFSPRPDQASVFKAQIDLAWELQLPIVVHSRESDEEVLQVLSENKQNILGCVLHCFWGNEKFAQSILDMGFYIGLDGPITYKASVILRGIVSWCPLDRLLIETDCPYLTPVPYRGKRNEPAYVRYVAEEAARAKGISTEELAAAVYENASELFKI